MQSITSIKKESGEKMENNLVIARDTFTLKHCIGELWRGDETERFCYTLEDVSRGENIKILHETALPAGAYLWKVTMSPRFKRNMILVYTEQDYSVKMGGISFVGIRIHGGNDDGDTSGCPLVCYNRVGNSRIYGTAEKALTEWAEQVGGKGTLLIVNKPA